MCEFDWVARADRGKAANNNLLLPRWYIPGATFMLLRLYVWNWFWIYVDQTPSPWDYAGGVHGDRLVHDLFDGVRWVSEV